MQQGTMPHAPAPGPQFFSDNRRGEVNELRQLLRLIQSERTDTQKQRDTIKKVIAFMTLGIDVSRLFSEMIMACCTPDIVQKKMIYLYLTTYAETNPELALLAVNTLLKDSSDDDPAICGLALRSLCSLRAPNMIEYVEPAVRRGLTSRSGYVRRTATIGVLKLWHLNPALVDGRNIDMTCEDGINKALVTQPNIETDSLVEILFAMMNDIDPQVVANVISVLNEIFASDGGIPFTKRIAANLLNRIRQLNEWGQCAVLNLIANYVPETDDELYDILNILEERIKHSSSAVVLSAARCFVDLTAGYKDLREPMFLRLKAPLLTLIATAPSEIAYVVLTHLQHLLSLFDDEEDEDVDREQSLVIRAMGSDYKLFFCAYSDPVYIKLVKLDVLSSVVSQTTAFSILSELSEYVVTDVDASVVRKSIEVMGQIGGRFPTMAEHLIDQLLSFMDLGVEFISAPGFVVIRNLLRHSPQLFSRVKEPLQRLFPLLTDPESTAAVLWIIGQFGDEIEEAPYLVETFIDSRENNDLSYVSNKSVGAKDKQGYRSSSSPQGSVLLELLTACLKLFLSRAPEMQQALGKLFNLILSDDAVDFDVRDRTLHFYRFLLEAKTMGSAEVVKLLGTVLSRESYDQPMPNFFEEIEAKSMSKTSVEFNTLSLLFKQPPDKFIVVKNPIDLGGRFVPSPSLISKGILEKSVPPTKLKMPKRLRSEYPTHQTIDVTDSLPGASNISSDLIENSFSSLLDTDDIVELGVPSSSSPNPLPSISSDEFEALWLKLPVGTRKSLPLRPDLQVDNVSSLLQIIPQVFSNGGFYCVVCPIQPAAEFFISNALC